MREKEIERELYRVARQRCGRAAKFVSPGWSGVPDRIVLLPGGKFGFVELKAPGKGMRANQIKRKRQLELLGFNVYCVCGKEQIEGVLDDIAKD